MVIKGNETLRQMVGVQQIICDFAGEAEVGIEWQSDSVCSAFTRIYRILDGEAVLTDETGEYHLKKEDIAVIPAGTRFSYRCPSALKKEFFHIRYPFAAGDVFSGLPCICVIKDMKKLPDVLQNDVFVSDAVALQCFFYEIAARCFSHPKYRKDFLCIRCTPLTERAIHYIEENLFAQPRVSQIAEAMSVSVSNLQKHFYREIGVSVGNYMRDKLLSAAEQYVVHSDLTVGEISDRLGFSDAFYFSNVFKRKFGLSPKNYRRNGY